MLSNSGLPAGLETETSRVDFNVVQQEQLSQALKESDALLLWDYFSKATRDAWSKETTISWIHVPTAGVDKLLFPELVSSPIVVTNARGIFDHPISEYVLGMILQYYKQFQLTSTLQKEHRWLHRESELISEKKALIIGTGAIGRAIARILRSVHIDIVGAGRSHRVDDEDFGIVLNPEEWHEQLKSFDIVVLICPLTKETQGLFGRTELLTMKDSSMLINAGRGELIDQNALIEALESPEFPIGAAAIDVATPEPLPADSALWDIHNLFISPHMSGDYIGWQQAAIRQYRHLISQWIAGESLDNQVSKDKGYSSLSSASAGRPA
ncbi:MAG: D-2-hydroxyacid dehydrogenase [Bifidobacterium subtile]|nr:D-2-hydroxyacid dehydrogenase [Bifidobacterium subtile]MCI1257796.1 D-2-hydroxyacid dehydrogenase [Bifidobacterium subtile]